MRTKLTIVGIVITCVIAAVGIFFAAAVWLGLVGVAACSVVAAALLVVYARLVRPWHSRWGATDDEVGRKMPGDDIIPTANMTTRAISIRCSPELLWPWLVQIGYGRAGWYSYDWIDNDGKPSVHHIVPDLQGLRPGDRIEMMPGFGPEVVELVANNHFVSGDVEGGTWCLAIYPDAGGSRLVSRWRQDWKSSGIASKFFISLADPGAFIMERKMLRGLKKRAESVHPTLDRSAGRGPRGPQKEVA